MKSRGGFWKNPVSETETVIAPSGEKVIRTRSYRRARRLSSRKKWQRRAMLAVAALGTAYVGYNGYQLYKARAAQAAEQAAAAQFTLDQAAAELAAKQKKANSAIQKAAKAETGVPTLTVIRPDWGIPFSDHAQHAKAKAAEASNLAADAARAEASAAQAVADAAVARNAAVKVAQFAAETVSRHEDDDRTKDIKLFNKPAVSESQAQAHFNESYALLESQFQAEGKRFSLKEERPFYESAAALLMMNKELLLGGQGEFLRKLLLFYKAGFLLKGIAKAAASTLGFSYLYSRIDTLFKRLREDKNEPANESFRQVFQHVIDYPGKNGSLRDIAKANNRDAYEYFNEILPNFRGGKRTRKTNL